MMGVRVSCSEEVGGEWRSERRSCDCRCTASVNLSYSTIPEGQEGGNASLRLQTTAAVFTFVWPTTSTKIKV